MKRTILIIIILIILVSCSDTSVHEKLFPSESTEPVLPAEPETQIFQISNMAELADFFSERNTESIGIVISNIELTPFQAVKLYARTDKTLYLNGSIISQEMGSVFELSEEKTTGNIVIANNPDSSRSVQRGAIKGNDTPINFAAGPDADFSVTIKDIDVTSEESEATILLRDMKNVTLENISINLITPTGNMVCGLRINNTAVQEINNVDVSVSLDQSIHPTVYGIKAEGSGTHIGLLTNTSVNISASDYVYYLNELTGMDISNADRIENCSVTIDSSDSGIIKSHDTYGFKLCNVKKLIDSSISINSVSNGSEMITGLYAYASQNDISMAINNIEANISVPVRTVSSETIKRISGISINGIYNENNNLNTSNTLGFHTSEITGTVTVNVQHDFDKLIGVEYRADKGTADLSSLCVDLSKGDTYNSKIFGVALNLSGEAEAELPEDGKITFKGTQSPCDKYMAVKNSDF